ncbi:hypothetical protein AAVH_09219 [Aphelenchoides avenae]|nr:hypothetical protein AAVH_09219 [Aphelenchus avenae]
MRKDTAEDVFVHKTHFLTMRSWVLPCPRKDDEVEFDVHKGVGGRYEAAAVSGPNGTLVRGRLAPRERRQTAPVKPANAQPLVKAKNVVPEENRDGPRMAPASDKRRRAASDEMIAQGADTKPEKKRRAPLRRQFRRKNKKTQDEDGGVSKPANDATANTEKDASSKNENGAPAKAEKEEEPKALNKPSKQKPSSENGCAKPAENGLQSQHVAVTA